VGYGMDVAHSYRELPFVGVVEKKSDENQLEMI
jgi:hypoxanthine-guanine phosphoribosyltransferase